MEMNLLLLLTPKKQVQCLDDSLTIRQALERFKAHKYTAVPIISKADGSYLGTIKEGDFLWYIYNLEHYDRKDLEEINVTALIKDGFMPPVKVSSPMKEVMYKAMQQNYVPVVDDRGIFMGIVTRRSVIEYLYLLSNKEKASK